MSKPIMVGILQLPPYDKMLEHDRRVYCEIGIAPTVCIVGGGNKEIKVMVDEQIIIDDTQGFDGVRIYKDTFPSLRAERQGLKVTTDTKRVRKLTERECYRLMDFDDTDFDKAKASGLSKSQLYKTAGNSICVGVLEAIFKQMLPDERSNPC